MHKKKNTSKLAQIVKNLSAMQETQVRSPGGEDPLEKGMATTPAFLSGELCGQRSLLGPGWGPWSVCHKDSEKLGS